MMNDRKIEYVYCMTNKSFNNDLVKIGWTTNDPNKRAQQLYTTGVPNPFTIEFIIKTLDGRTLESRIHSYLARYRESKSREFFNISVQDVRDILEKKLNLTLSDPEPEVTYERPHHSTPIKRFERCSKQDLLYFYDISGKIDARPVFIHDDLCEDISTIFEKFRYNPSP